MALRKQLGCHGNAPRLYRLGEYETDTCPRRHIRNNPWIIRVSELGAPEHPTDLDLSNIAVEALHIQQAATAWRLAEEAKNASKNRG